MEVPDETSPISSKEESIAVSIDSGDSTEAVIRLKSPTDLSNEVEVSHITPIKIESSSREDLKQLTTTNNWTRAAVWAGIIRKSRSMPELNISIGTNCLATKIGDGNASDEVRICTRRRLFSLQDLGQDSYGSIDEFVSRWSSNSNFEDKSEMGIQSNVAAVGKILSAITLGVGASNDLLQGKATPNGRSIKRSLLLSPETVVGSPRKFRLHEIENLSNKDLHCQGHQVIDVQNQHQAVDKVVNLIEEQVKTPSRLVKPGKLILQSPGNSPKLPKRKYNKKSNGRGFIGARQRLISDMMSSSSNRCQNSEGKKVDVDGIDGIDHLM